MPRYLWCPVVRCANCLITEGWVTCADESRLPHGVSDPDELIDRLRRLCASGEHTFWSDYVTLRTALDDAVMARLQGCQQITDCHLAALAVQRLVAWPRSTAACNSLLAGTPPRTGRGASNRRMALPFVNRHADQRWRDARPAVVADGAISALPWPETGVARITHVRIRSDRGIREAGN